MLRRKSLRAFACLCLSALFLPTPVASAQQVTVTRSGAGPNANSTVEGFRPARNAQVDDLDDIAGVSLHNGEVSFGSRIFETSALGMYLPFDIHYRSQIDYSGPIGRNWSHNWEQRVWLDGSELVHFDGVRFAVDEYEVNGTLQECSTPGVYRKARLVGNEWQIRFSEGTVLRFHTIDASATSGKLESMTDAFGRSISLAYTAAGDLQTLTDSSGRDVSLTYHASTGLLETITDHGGRTWTFATSADDLVSVTTPAITGTPVFAPDGSNNDFPAGRALGFTYTTASETDPRLRHNLTGVIYPAEAASGDAAMEFAYNGDVLQTLTREWHNDWGTLDGGNTVYTIDPIAKTASKFDAFGVTTDYTFNDLGNTLTYELFTAGLHPNDPGSFLKTCTFSAEGELESLAYPSGDSRQFIYLADTDRFQAGNVDVIRHFSSIAEDKRYSIVHNYEPIYNRRTPTNHAEVAPTFDYQEGDPLLTGLQAMVDDWGIDVGSYPLNLGDQNGDGVTDQIAGQQIVTTSSPVVDVFTGASSQIILVKTYKDDGRVLTTCTAEGALTLYTYGSDASGGYLQEVIADIDPLAAPPNGGTAYWTKPAGVAHVAASSKWVRDTWGYISSERNARGIRTVFTRNVLGEVLRAREAVGIGTNIDPDLVALWSLAGHMVLPAYETYGFYDANGNLVRSEVENRNAGFETNPWSTTTWSYNRQNLQNSMVQELDSSTDALTRYLYDDRGNQISATSPEGNEDSFAYDERNFLWKSIAGSSDGDVSGETTYHYTPNGKIREIEHPDDLDGDGLREKTLYVYDGRHRLMDEISPVGTVRRQLYDGKDFSDGFQVLGALGGPSKTQNDTTGNVLLSEIRFTRDALNRIVTQTDVAFVPDTNLSLPYTYNPGDSVTLYQYDRDGNITRTRDPNGDEVSFTYDGLMRQITALDPVGNYTLNTYDKGGNLRFTRTEEVDHLGNPNGEEKSAWMLYDGLGRLVRTTDTEGRCEYRTYSSQNQVVAQADSRTASAPTLDPLGILPPYLLIGSPGNAKRFSRDASGRVRTVASDLHVDGLGNSMAMLFANFNPSTPLAAAEAVTQMVYDRNDRLTSTTTGGKTVSMLYDDRDRMFRRTFPDLTYFDLEFNRDGSILEQRDYDALFNLHGGMTLSRDGDSRVVSSELNQLSLPGSSGTHYEYSGLNQETRMVDDNGPLPDSVVTRSWDSLGRMLVETQDGYTVTTEYDAHSNRVGLWYPNGRHLTRGYDELDRLESIFDGLQPVAQSDYFGVGRLAHRTLGNNVSLSLEQPLPSTSDVTGYSPDGNRRNAFHLDPGGLMIDRYEEAYDVNEQRVAEARELYSPPGVGASTLSDAMEYDSLDRLRRFERDDDGFQADRVQEYDIDQDSTWLSMTVNGLSHAFGTGLTWAYDSIAGEALQHDSAGNRTGDRWFTYIYDGFDRLIEVKRNDNSQTFLRFGYDAYDRRIRKEFTNTKSQLVTTRYLYDRDEVVEERTGLGSLVAQYVQGDMLDDVIQMRRDLDSNGSLDDVYYLMDPFGNVSALTDDTGNVIERYTYDAYGAPRFLNSAGVDQDLLSSAWNNPRLFTGTYYDHEFASMKEAIDVVHSYFTPWSRATGQYYFRSRHMDPAEGRFLTRDPMSVDGNTTMQPHLLVGRILDKGTNESPYAFVANSPHNRKDPLGQQDTRPPVMPDGSLAEQYWDDKVQRYRWPAGARRPDGGPAAGGQFAPPPEKPAGRVPRPRGGGGWRKWVKGAAGLIGVVDIAESLWASGLTGILNPDVWVDTTGSCVANVLNPAELVTGKLCEPLEAEVLPGGGLMGGTPKTKPVPPKTGASNYSLKRFKLFGRTCAPGDTGPRAPGPGGGAGPRGKGGGTRPPPVTPANKSMRMVMTGRKCLPENQEHPDDPVSLPPGGGTTAPGPVTPGNPGESFKVNKRKKLNDPFYVPSSCKTDECDGDECDCAPNGSHTGGFGKLDLSTEKPALLALDISPGVERNRLSWAFESRGAGTSYSLQTLCPGSNEWVALGEGVLEGSALQTATDTDAVAGSQYRLLVAGPTGSSWEYGPFEARSAPLEEDGSGQVALLSLASMAALLFGSVTRRRKHTSAQDN